MARTRLCIFAAPKGGVGKSTLAKMYTQYHIKRDRSLRCYDTDSKNNSFQLVKGLNVTGANYMDGETVHVEKWEAWIDDMFDTENRVDVIVVDCGASNYEHMIRGLDAMDFEDVCATHGFDLEIHYPMKGGADAGGELDGLEDILRLFKSAKIFVWKNEYEHEIVVENGRLEDTEVFRNHSDRLQNVIAVPKMRHKVTHHYFKLIFDKHMTFDEAMQSKAGSVTARAHVGKYWRAMQKETARVADGEQDDSDTAQPMEQAHAGDDAHQTAQDEMGSATDSDPMGEPSERHPGANGADVSGELSGHENGDPAGDDSSVQDSQADTGRTG